MSTNKHNVPKISKDMYTKLLRILNSNCIKILLISILKWKCNVCVCVCVCIIYTYIYICFNFIKQHKLQ